MSLKFKCSPELADGDHFTVYDTPEQVAEVVKIWCEYQKECEDIGEGFQVETIEMSDEEYKNMPEI